MRLFERVLSNGLPEQLTHAASELPEWSLWASYLRNVFGLEWIGTSLTFELVYIVYGSLKRMRILARQSDRGVVWNEITKK